MFIHKSKKGALLTSGVSLLLCVAMFVGSTFAWFTDSVTSTNNKIVAGSLQVDLELLERDGSWTSIKESQKAIFDYDNWEPGYTDVKVLRVVNEGNLALKWIAKLTADQELSDLAKVIDVYVKQDITAYPAHRVDLTDWQKVGTVAEFVNKIGETANGNLKAGDTAYLGIAFKMQEGAENEYQNAELGSTFDIRIFATQYTHENDSFDNTYDAEAFPKLTNAVYFSSLRNAMGMINNGTISDGSSDCSENEAKASVKWEKGQYVISLLDSLTENAPIEVTENMTLVLNGHCVTFNDCNTGFMIPQDANIAFYVDGQIAGSSISIAEAEGATAIQVNAGVCSIVGGTYASSATDAGKEQNPISCIQVNGSAVLNISNATVNASDANKGTPCGIYVGENSSANITNCDVLASSPYGLGVHGVHNLGSAVITDSSLKGFSNYTGNKAGTAYESHSRGAYNTGKMELINCHVIGTHSGVTTLSTLFVNGGIYESYGHGGIYFGGSNTTSYVKDATVQWCDMPDGYYDDGIAGTNKAGMYIGGVSKENIVVYVDNCHFYGPVQPIVIRGTSKEKNDALYISNSTINTTGKVRIDANNYLMIGSGNNFSSQNTSFKTSKKGTVETTNLDYRTIIDAAFEVK